MRIFSNQWKEFLYTK